MRKTMLLLVAAMMTTSLAVGCGDDNNNSTPTSPTTPGGGGGSPQPPSGGNNQPPSGASAPTTAAVTVGDIFFKSAHNGSSNPAVDTVAVNGMVTWTWGAGATLPHSIESTGSPSFTSSGIQTGAGNTYQFTFSAAGSYQYDCGVHGNLMTGTIVVVD
jgi:plastocyanin